MEKENFITVRIFMEDYKKIIETIKYPENFAEALHKIILGDER